jgi:large subunit ribosomal protein L21
VDLTISNELGKNFSSNYYRSLDMQAIIKTGGKQYIVKPGDVVKVEKLGGNSGDVVEFKEVLMVSDENGTVKVGSPFVDGASVRGRILKNEKGEKIIVFKFKRRKNYRRKRGHRQIYTHVEIQEIIS